MVFLAEAPEDKFGRLSEGFRFNEKRLVNEAEEEALADDAELKALEKKIKRDRSE